VIQKILLPLDGSQLAEKALPYAEALAQKFGAELILIWVIQEPVIVPQVDYYGTGMPFIETMIATEEKEAAEYLHSLKERFRQQNIPTRTAVLKGHSVADAIIEKASQEGVDVIVKTTHGRSGLSQWIFGNVAAKVLQRAPCPVFLIRVSQKDAVARP
jgi:nucleotide-binding universal stress UspA family protein